MPPDEEDNEISMRQLEIDEDEEVIEHFRRQLKQADTRQKMSEVRKLVQSSSPAKAHMPVTTPRLSTSPRRPRSSEQLYQKKAELPDVGEVSVTSEKDSDMSKLFLQMGTLSDQQVSKSIKQELQAEQTTSIQKEIGGASEQPGEGEDPLEFTSPIQPGSPAANAILAEYMESRRRGKLS